jgi:hypothetical protein
MSDTITKLVEGTCPLAGTDVYTAPSKTSVLSIDIANPTGSAQTVTVKLNAVLLFSVSMPAVSAGGSGVTWHGPQVLESGQKINIVATDATCTYNITGVVII